MPGKRQDQTAQTPLSPAELYILLALMPGEKHGYAILQGVEKTSQGKVRLNTGTLYRTLKRLLGEGLIVEVEDRPAVEGEDERRRYYRISDDGSRAVMDEARRMEQVVESVKKARLLAKPAMTAILQGV